MELASYRNSGVLDSDVASGFLENLWTPDAGILQKRSFFFLIPKEGWMVVLSLEVCCLFRLYCFVK